jgi:hypothetical protein
MSILAAALAIVGVLCALNLLLTFGVIRRLREHTALLSDVSVPDSPIMGLKPGDRPGPFSAVTAGGAAIDGARGLRVVGFFSTSCSICPERVPMFVDYLAKHRVPAERVLAVVNGHETTPAPYLDTLRAVAQVCTEAHDGPIARAFRVTGFPAFALLDEHGDVIATEYVPSRLPEPGRALAVK